MVSNPISVKATALAIAGAAGVAGMFTILISSAPPAHVPIPRDRPAYIERVEVRKLGPLLKPIEPTPVRTIPITKLAQMVPGTQTPLIIPQGNPSQNYPLPPVPQPPAQAYVPAPDTTPPMPAVPRSLASPPVSQDTLTPTDRAIPYRTHQRAPERHTEARRASDICARHNMRKVYTSNGKSWRCRRWQS